MKRIIACLMILSFMAVAAGCATSDDDEYNKKKGQVYEGTRPQPTKRSVQTMTALQSR